MKAFGSIKNRLQSIKTDKKEIEVFKSKIKTLKAENRALKQQIESHMYSSFECPYCAHENKKRAIFYKLVSPHVKDGEPKKKTSRGTREFETTCKNCKREFHLDYKLKGV